MRYVTDLGSSSVGLLVRSQVSLLIMAEPFTAPPFKVHSDTHVRALALMLFEPVVTNSICLPSYFKLMVLPKKSRFECNGGHFWSRSRLSMIWLKAGYPKVRCNTPKSTADFCNSLLYLNTFSPIPQLTQHNNRPHLTRITHLTHLLSSQPSPIPVSPSPRLSHPITYSHQSHLSPLRTHLTITLNLTILSIPMYPYRPHPTVFISPNSPISHIPISPNPHTLITQLTYSHLSSPLFHPIPHVTCPHVPPISPIPPTHLSPYHCSPSSRQ